MQEYPVRRGHAKKTDLKAVFETAFGSASVSGEWVVCKYGALASIKARYEGATSLVVDTEQDRTADLETGQRTIKAWNQFLEAATGYTAKQRGKKAQDLAKKAAG